MTTLAVLAALLTIGAQPALACDFGIRTDPRSTADGFVFEAQWTTGSEGNSGISVESQSAGSITWSLIDSYPDGEEIAEEPDGHGAGQGVRFVISGLAPLQSADVTVSAVIPAECSFTPYSFPVSASGTALAAAGVAPELSEPSGTADGFRFTIANFDADATYQLAASTGTADRDGDVVTVSSLEPGASAEVTVTAVKAGYTNASSSVTGTALAAGVPPALSAATRTADGFTVTIEDFDPDAGYEVDATAGTATRDGAGVTITGLAPGTNADLTVTVSRDGATDASSSITGTALAAGILPSLSTATPTRDGFAFRIDDYNAEASYDVGSNAGTVARDGAEVTVSGLASGASAEVTVTVTSPGAMPATATVTGTALPAPVHRLAGSDRVGTAVTLSQDSFPTDASAGAVVLARADSFADALAGTPLAVELDAPLLLTATDQLGAATEEEIARVLPETGTVHVLGGEKALSAQIDERLEELGFTVQRYAGGDRFATAALIAANGLASPDVVFLASGLDYPDGLVGGAAAAVSGGAVLLTAGDVMPGSTSAYLDGAGDARRIAVGGPAAAADANAEALVGRNRFETAVAVAEEVSPSADVVGVATGEGFADALAGGAHVAREGGTLLLSSSGGLSDSARDYVAAHRDTLGKVHLYGGQEALSDDVLDDLTSLFETD